MKLWLDNTGIHSVGACFDGNARGNFDIKGLLQFATYMIFSTCGTFLDILTSRIIYIIRDICHATCGTFLDILTSRIIYIIRDICHADQE